jgi:1-aminocyclopropane-1-carboxylate deaminase
MTLDLESRFPRMKLGFWPSPIHPLPRLSKELGIEVWAKRDDVSSGLAFGGNKVRKLEWLAADAVAQGCDTLVSIGNIQSNHTRQVAAVAAVLGMRCRLVQEEWTRWEDPVYGKVGNILLSRLMGAETLLEGEGYSTAVKETWERALEQVRREGGKPYAIPAGASDHPLGGLGYANFADEVAAQEVRSGATRQEPPARSRSYICSAEHEQFRNIDDRRKLRSIAPLARNRKFESNSRL